MGEQIELLNCPFCGKPPLVEYREPIGGGWSVRCYMCAHTPGVMDRQREAAYAMWNRRAPASLAQRSDDSPSALLYGQLEDIADDATFLREFARIGRYDFLSGVRFALLDRIAKIADRLTSGGSDDRAGVEPAGDVLTADPNALPLGDIVRIAFLAGVEEAVGAERCGAGYDAPSRVYASRVVQGLRARLSGRESA